MENYIAVVKNKGSKVTKFADFASKSDADAHVVTYGGFVVDKPSSDQTRYWVVDSDKKTLIHDKSTADSDYAAALLNLNKDIRRRAYPEIGDQLDLLYKDMLADKGDKTGEWVKVVKKVKDDNPKP